MRPSARAPRSRSVSPFNVTDTFPPSLRPLSPPRTPPRRSPLAHPGAGPAPPPRGLSSLSRAPVNQPGCQSAGGSSARRRRGRLPASAIAAPGAGAGAGAGPPAPGLGKQSAISFRGSRAGEGARSSRRGCRRRLSYPRVSLWGAPRRRLMYFMPNSPPWRLSQEARRPASIRPPRLLSAGAGPAPFALGEECFPGSCMRLQKFVSLSPFFLFHPPTHC